MGRAPCCEKIGLNRGPWTREEDLLLTQYINVHGEGSWRTLPKAAGLRRCGKSCRLRWINYLRPDLKRGNISEEEDQLIIKLHSLLGNRWSLIAGRLPGRTDNEIKNYWNTHLKKKLRNMGIDPNTHRPLSDTIANSNQALSSQQSINSSSFYLPHEDLCSDTQMENGIISVTYNSTDSFSFQKLLGLHGAKMEYNSAMDYSYNMLRIPSSTASIVSKNSSMADMDYYNQPQLSYQTCFGQHEVLPSPPKLGPVNSDTTSSSNYSMATDESTFDTYTMAAVEGQACKMENESVPLFSYAEMNLPDYGYHNNMMLNMINSDGPWDVDMVRSIEDMDSSLILAETGTTDLWNSHYLSSTMANAQF